MKYEFTPAAHRALLYAAEWSGPGDCNDLQPQMLLMGLLAEPECRAATILLQNGVDSESVLEHWPDLQCRDPALRNAPTAGNVFSTEVELALQAACRKALATVHPPELATEHILLGLVSVDGATATWLREQGMESEALGAEIDRLHGVRAEPLPLESLPIDMEDLTPPPARASLGDEPLGDTLRVLPQDSIGAVRALDAATNRVREGLRTVEDYVRFVLDDRHLTGLCKQMRHDLAAVAGRIPSDRRLAARDTQADVGTTLTTASEQQRQTSAGVLTANFLRVQEGLRSLEEFAKLSDPAMAAAFKQLRYQSYTLQRAVEITRGCVARLDHARLYVLIDGRSSVDQFRELATSLINAGADVLQLRDKRLDDRQLLERARVLRQLTQGTQTLFIMNDRPDLAALSAADGVHVGQEEISVKDARTIVGPDALIGVSTHSIDQARRAVLDGASYIGVGPTFPSETKQFDRFPGLALLETVSAESRLPAFAIGGITPDNLEDVLATGVTRVAVSAAITEATDPGNVVAKILAMLAEQKSG